MKFKHGTRRRAAEYEKDWVQRWKDDQTFEKSVAQRPVDNAYVFYDGPPFITGVPHHGTLLSSIVKDAVPRYWTMKGKRVERRWGWDCHGLPAENFVEKQMNIMDRRQIVTSSDQPAPLDKDGNPLPTISLEKYITKARESMVANSETWQGVIDRIGRWVDFKGAYRTMDKNFMESVWWAFKQLYEAGKIYEGEKVLMYDTKFATPVSKAEVTMDNDAYQTVTDPSVYVKFKLLSGNTRRKITLDKSSKILFVCNANVVRSQMAQAFYNHFTKTQNADSAGVNAEKYPTTKIPTVADFDAHLVAKNLDPLAVIDLMREKGIEVGASQRTQLTKGMLRDYDLVINIANRNQTPDWLKGDNVVWWKIEDPHAESRELAKLACDEVEKRVKKLISGEVVDDTQKLVGFDECERSYVGALLVDTNGKLIAQQRDDKPGITNPGMVSLFGGTSHESESPIETLRRELREELELEVNSNNLLLQTVKHENGTNVACSIYIVTGVDAEKLKLHEGAGFAMGTPEELLSCPVTGVTQQAIEAFINAQSSVSVLAWTTTPWTLPANLMLAVNPDMTYCEVLVDGEKLIIAEEALERTLQDEKHQPLDYEVLRKFLGSELVGKAYQPLDTGSAWPENDKIHTIYAADFVSHESGTGIVHIAPAYGEDDFELAKRYGISAFHVIDDNGYYTDGNYKGLEVWDNNKFIAKDLKEKGVVWKIEYIRHEYPFNPRSKQRIMYRAIPSWFFDIQGQKPLMLDENEHINWFPAHLKHGRFAKNIEQAPDWNLSRDRFWATAMPVWKGDRGTVKVVGSYAELKELSGVELDDYHRPWVDDITFEIDGEKFTRIDKVLDCWFESGSMPFAQLHYPFENQTKFEQNYPADFIVEYIGQVRAWFYYVHAVNAALAEIGAFGEAGAQHKNAYSNVITTGVVAGNDGRKMSKSLGNFTDPNELMDKFSADSLRFLLLGSPLLNGEDFALHDKDVGDVARKLSMIWNMYDFFTMYAEVDGWEFDGTLIDPLSGRVVSVTLSSIETASARRESYPPATGDAAELAALKQSSHLPDADGRDSRVRADVSEDEVATSLTNPLDIWIISRLHELVAEVEKQMDAYNIPDALSPILPFLDDASNWYVRRSRRRFWKSEDDGDKNDAYRTLHYVLVRLSYILAPFTPFLAEELYHNLTGDNESIHLKDWLTAGAVNDQVLADMSRTRELINNGLSLRMKQDEHQVSIKVRQPLQCAAYAGVKLTDYYEQIMAEELNVKEIRWIESLDEHLADYDVTEGVIKPESWVEISKHLTSELKREGLMREVIRHVQSARKKAGLQVDDRIELGITSSDSEITQAVDVFADTIKAETLAVKLGLVADGMEKYDVKVDGKPVEIYLKKHN